MDESKLPPAPWKPVIDVRGQVFCFDDAEGHPVLIVKNPQALWAPPVVFQAIEELPALVEMAWRVLDVFDPSEYRGPGEGSYFDALCDLRDVLDRIRSAPPASSADSPPSARGDAPGSPAATPPIPR